MEGQDMALVPWRLLEVLDVQRRPDGIHVAAQDATREIHRREDAAARSGRDRVVDRIVRIRGNDVAGVNAVQRIRTGDTAEVDVLKVRLSRRGPRHDVAFVIAVCDADAGETVLDRVAG